MHNLCISFSKVPVELKFLITLTSMLKAEFLTVKEEERGRPDLQDPAQARGLAESATGSHNASLCLEAGEAKPASVAVLLNLGFPGSRSSGRPAHAPLQSGLRYLPGNGGEVPIRYPNTEGPRGFHKGGAPPVRPPGPPDFSGILAHPSLTAHEEGGAAGTELRKQPHPSQAAQTSALLPASLHC